MIVAGCDVGSLTAKAVILNERKILGSAMIRSRARPEDSALAVMEEALVTAGLSKDSISYCVGTGYGRDRIPFVQRAVSEISCHGTGARWVLPSVRTVIDIGGQDCKAMKMDSDGRIVKFITNDKCAAGTGRFLEVMADVLGLPIDQLGPLSARSRRPLSLASTCTVWAQAEVIHHLNAGASIEDVAAAVNQAMANRVAILANSVGVEREVCMSGGVAKNTAVVAALEGLLGIRMKRHRVDPQLIGALGAAVEAQKSARSAQ